MLDAALHGENGLYPQLQQFVSHVREQLSNQVKNISFVHVIDNMFVGHPTIFTNCSAHASHPCYTVALTTEYAARSARHDGTGLPREHGYRLLVACSQGSSDPTTVISPVELVHPGMVPTGTTIIEFSVIDHPGDQDKKPRSTKIARQNSRSSVVAAPAEPSYAVEKIEVRGNLSSKWKPVDSRLMPAPVKPIKLKSLSWGKRDRLEKPMQTEVLDGSELWQGKYQISAKTLDEIETLKGILSEVSTALFGH